MWIWEKEKWPNFTYEFQRLQPLLRDIVFLQGELYGSSHSLDTESKNLDTILANIIYSSDIEGEKLDARSVRSSLANRLGVSEGAPYPTDKRTEGLIESALDAINNLDETLSKERLYKWHSLIFPEGNSMFNKVEGGSFRDGPVQVVSGRLDKPVVHFEAPPAVQVEREIAAFIAWFNDSHHNVEPDPILRAGIAHLWFLTIHPFEDGNGRIGRLIMDLALAQAEKNTVRLYAMSQTINERRKEYYSILEHTQRQDVDITEWLIWFVNTLHISIKATLFQVQLSLNKTKYWNRFDQCKLRAEQVKVLNRMLDGDFADGINNRQYMSVARVSRASATRHLTELIKHGFLVESENGGRSSRYKISLNEVVRQGGSILK